MSRVNAGLIGWTPLMKKAVRKQVSSRLRQFLATRTSAAWQGVEARG